MVSTVLFQTSKSSQDSPLPPPAKMRKIEWPGLHINGVSYSTEFDSNTWKCPLCCCITGRIKQHLTAKHKDLIQEWEEVEQYCREVSVLKRKELDRQRAQDPNRKELKREIAKKIDAKRANKPERKEVKRKADAKRADQPERKEVKKKAGKKFDAKRAEKPERKVVKKRAGKKVDAKRADKPERKEVLKKARKKHSDTVLAKFAKIIANGRYQDKLGETRRKAQWRKYAQSKIDRARGGDAVTRRIKFQKGVLRGPEYVCSCCHRSLFRKSVTAVTEKLREKIKQASEEKIRKANEKNKTGSAPPSFEFNERKNSNKLQEEETPALTKFDERKNSNNIQEEATALGLRRSKLKRKTMTMLSFEANAFKAWSRYLLKSVGSITYLCSTCKSSLQKGNIPAMAVANSLQLNHPDRPALTELENNLIAFNINFQKIVLLPKSRMAAGKGRMISVPVGPEDVMNTVKQMPRLPNDAGLVPIKLKRKKEYKSAEKSERIRPEIIFQALRYLKKAGHPFYQFYDDEETYKARCRIKNQRGLELLEDEDLDLDDNLEEDLGKPITPDVMEVEDEAVKDSDEEGEDELEIAVEQEEEDIQNDPVRRQHFNYSEYSALVNGHPEIFLDSDGNQRANLTFAPGEGKKPTSFLDMPAWEYKSWPTLLPDGKFGLHHKRRIKLTRQQYFAQRMLNVDDRFAKTPGYLFGAMSMVEADRLRSNANLTGMKGKRSVGPGGQVSYQLEDPCSVFEKIPGTPKYWQRVKFEIIAKLENIGPFQVKK